MADTDDFKIKGAAQKSEMLKSSSEVHKQKESSEKAAAQADDGKSEIVDKEQEEPHSIPDEEKFHWYKCETTMNDQIYYYWIHKINKESRWEEPDEPYFIWDPITQGPDNTGLHTPSHLAADVHKKENDAADAPTQEPLPYNPKIHGSYDENAPYAQHWKNKWAEDAGIKSQASADSKIAYTSALATNRRTGKVAGPDARGPEHLSAAAKSGRQLHGYFDPDAHANSHDGRSLKEERRNKRFTKEEIRAFQNKRKERKEQKRRAFLTT